MGAAPNSAPPAPEAPTGPDPTEDAHLQALATLQTAEAAREAEHAAAMVTLATTRAELEAATARLATVARNLEAERTALLGEMRAGVAALVLEGARRIAGDALQADPRLVDALVDAGVRALGHDGLVIRVTPADAERVQARLPGMHVVADETIDGGCAVEGPAGRIDATAATAVAAVRTVLSQWAVR
jgi:flagellar biosynthesis/type III secretory pathway protein FliH